MTTAITTENPKEATTVGVSNATPSSVPVVVYHAVRKSPLLDGPAIFWHVEDVQKFSVAEPSKSEAKTDDEASHDNDNVDKIQSSLSTALSESQSFENIQDAMNYINNDDAPAPAVRRPQQTDNNNNDHEQRQAEDHGVNTNPPSSSKKRKTASSSTTTMTTAASPSSPSTTEVDGTDTTAHMSLALPDTNNPLEIQIRFPKELDGKRLGFEIGSDESKNDKNRRPNHNTDDKANDTSQQQQQKQQQSSRRKHYIKWIHPTSCLNGILCMSDTLVQVNGESIEGKPILDVVNMLAPATEVCHRRPRSLQVRRYATSYQYNQLALAPQTQTRLPTKPPVATPALAATAAIEAVPPQVGGQFQQQLPAMPMNLQSPINTTRAHLPSNINKNNKRSRKTRNNEEAKEAGRQQLVLPPQQQQGVLQEPPETTPFFDLPEDFVPSISWLIKRATNLDFDARMDPLAQEAGEEGEEEESRKNEFRPPRHRAGKPIPIVNGSQPNGKMKATMILVAEKWGYSDVKPGKNKVTKQIIREAAIRTVAYDSGFKKPPKGGRYNSWLKDFKDGIRGIGDGLSSTNLLENDRATSQLSRPKYYDKIESSHPGYLVRIYNKAAQNLVELKRTTTNANIDCVQDVAMEMNRLSANDSEFEKFPNLEMTKSKLRLWMRDKEIQTYVELRKAPGKKRSQESGEIPRERRCKVQGCTKQIKRFGLCQRHGGHCKRCSIEGCNKQQQWGIYKGYCKPHGKEFLAARAKLAATGAVATAANSTIAITARGAQQKPQGDESDTSDGGMSDTGIYTHASDGGGYF